MRIHMSKSVQNRYPNNVSTEIEHESGSFDLDLKNYGENSDKSKQFFGLAKCELCGKFYSNKSNLIFHQRTAHPNERLYKCDECDHRFAYRKQLTEHRRSEHTIDATAQQYSCSKCGRIFKRRENLQSHQINMHSNEFKCDFCDMIFTQKSDLFDHRKVHADDNPYACEYCGRTLWSKSSLYAHQRYAHLKVREFECTECGKRFVYESHLKVHLQSHSSIEHPVLREYRYECWMCHKK